MALKVVGFVTVLIVIAGLAFILIFSSDSDNEVKVPDGLIGLSEIDACKKIEKKGLICKVKYIYDKNTFEEDVVLSVNPKSLSKVKEGNVVTIKVSSFEDTVLIEDYTGRNLELVKAELESYGIRVVTKSEKVTEEDEKEENTIISQSVEKDERLQKDNGVIELIYATLITVYPDFTDGTYNKELIEQFCDDNKIKCEFKEEEDNNFNEGSIILQSRGVGDEVKAGTRLIITIATNTKEEVEGN